jgi:hypothetical protein
LQIEIGPSTILFGVFVGGCILFTLYLFVKTCLSGPTGRTERHGGTPREDDLTVTSSSYGYEASYSPGNRASTSGPFPVGGRVQRSPTRSFSSYTNPRTKSKKQESGD